MMTKTIIKQYQFEEMLEAGIIKKFDETNTSHKVKYYVSIFGNLYSQNENTGKIRQLKLSPCGAGYLRANINGKTQKVHIIVAETFYRTRDRDKGEVINHLDGNKLNNHKDNLEITTQSNNIKHAWENKLSNSNKTRKLSFAQAEQIRMLYRTEGLSYNALSRMFNCTTSSIIQIINFQTYKSELKRNA